jgi:hypothetical protein
VKTGSWATTFGFQVSYSSKHMWPYLATEALWMASHFILDHCQSPQYTLRGSISTSSSPVYSYSLHIRCCEAASNTPKTFHHATHARHSLVRVFRTNALTQDTRKGPPTHRAVRTYSKNTEHYLALYSYMKLLSTVSGVTMMKT